MKVAIYSPYLDTFGGGEKYMATIAEILSLSGFKVHLLLDSHLNSIGADYLRNKLSERFGLNLATVDFIKGPVGKGSNILDRSLFLKNYDILFYLTDGSIFYPTAKKNILHIQSPLIGQPVKSLWGKLKLKGWNLIIYNSIFTRDNSKENWPIRSEIIYPPVDTDKIVSLEKKKYILSVGRFFGYLKDKKQKVLIEAFIKLFETGKMKDWSLHLAGSASSGDEPYLAELKKISGGFPVKFYANIPRKDLIRLYGESSIYWHAAGFGENEPTKMEHFGISTVEAMAAGCVPIVIKKGGQQEIVDSGKSGFLWDSLDELIGYTIKIAEDKQSWGKVSENAKEKSKIFSKAMFKERIMEVCKI